MRKKTRINQLLVVFAVALLAGAWSFTALVDTAWATKPSEPPGGGKPGGGGDGTAPVYHQVDLGTLNPYLGYTYPTAITELGHVAGGSVGSTGYMRAFIVTPLDTDGDAAPDTWHQDLDGDGVNDLMIDLGIPNGHPGPLDTYAEDVNVLGQVVGHSLFWDAVNGTNVYHAILVNPEDTDSDGQPDTWYRDDDADGANDLMIVLNGGQNNDAVAINDLGQVVLGVDNRASLINPVVENGVQTWFLDENGDGTNDLLIDLGTFDGNWSWPEDINSRGQVVGHSYYANDIEYGAFVINPLDSDGNGQPDTWYRDDDSDGRNDLAIELAPFEASSTAATAINDAGQVAVTREANRHPYLLTPEDTDGDGTPDNWYRDQDGDGVNDLMMDLGLLNKQDSGYAYAMNNSAQVVGQSSGRQGSSLRTFKNFLWENGELKELDPLTDSDAPIGVPWDINDAGQIVTYGGYILLPIEPTP